MRYVIVSTVKGEAGIFNNNLRKEVYENLGAKSSKLPAHFTIKSPFEGETIDDLESLLEDFSLNNNSYPYKIYGYDYFDNRVIYMKVLMSEEGQILHDNLIDKLNTLDYINFKPKEGKDKIFHVTVSSKKIQPIFTKLWDYVNEIPCNFDCIFDNISIYKWQDNTWVLHKEYKLL